MPVLSATDKLPARPRRVLVAGTSGSGKTRLARIIAGRLGVPHVELDALFHGPGWTRRPQFEDDVERFTSQPSWATEWQYPRVRQLLLDRADCLVWLDLPRRVVMVRVVRRTVGRRLARRELWNGNTEPPFRAFLTDPEYIVRWAWRTHDQTGAQVAAAAANRPDLPVVRLSSAREVRAWVRGPLRAAAGISAGTGSASAP